jgi:competence protein ComEC
MPRVTVATAAHRLPHLAPTLPVVSLLGGLAAPAVSPPVPAAPLVVAAAAGALAALAGRGVLALAGLAVLLGAAGAVWAGARMEATAPARPALPARLADGVVTADGPARRTRRGWRVPVSVDREGHAGAAGLRGARLLLETRADPPAQGAVMVVRGQVRAAVDARSPGWWRRYLERMRVAGALRPSRMTVIGARGGPAGARDRAVAWLRARIGTGLTGDRRALVEGMALGGSDRLSRSAEDDVRAAGLAHLLAVSGQNVAVVAAAVFMGLGALGVRRRRALVVAAVTIGAYCAVCESGASVARAGVVALGALAAEATSRPWRSGHGLLVALALLLAWQPRWLWDPGLQLSFSAVAGILLIGRPLVALAGRWLPGPLAEAAGVSAAATLATAPVAAASFGTVSLAGLAANILAVPLAGVVLLAGLGGAVLAGVAPWAGAPVLWCAGAGAEVILGTARVAARVPGATVALPPAAAPLAAMPAMGVWLLALRARRRGGW